MTLENGRASLSEAPKITPKIIETKEFLAPKNTIWEYPAATQFWAEKQDRIRKTFIASVQINGDPERLKSELATLHITPELTLIEFIKKLDPIRKTRSDDWVLENNLISHSSSPSSSLGVRSGSDLARLIQVYLILEKLGVSKNNSVPVFTSIDGELGRFTEKSIAAFQIKNQATESQKRLQSNIQDLRSAPFQNWMKSKFDQFLTQNVRAGKGVETALTKNAQMNFLKNGTIEMKMYDLTVIYNPTSSSLDVLLPNKEKVSFPVSFPLTTNKDTGGVLLMGNTSNDANIEKLFQYAAFFGFAHSKYMSSGAPHPAEKFSVSRRTGGVKVDTTDKTLDTNILSGPSVQKLMIDEAARLSGTKLQIQSLNPVYRDRKNVMGESYKNAEDVPEDLNLLRDMMPEDIASYLNRMLELSKPKQENEKIQRQGRQI